MQKMYQLFRVDYINNIIFLQAIQLVNTRMTIKCYGKLNSTNIGCREKLWSAVRLLLTSLRKWISFDMPWVIILSWNIHFLGQFFVFNIFLFETWVIKNYKYCQNLKLFFCFYLNNFSNVILFFYGIFFLFLQN